MFSPLSDDEILAYCSEVPLALALERLIEIRILRSLKFTSPILDLGSGDGIFARHTFRGSEIEVAIDPSSSEISFASRSEHNYSLLCRSSGGDLPIRDRSISTVFSNSVLEHIADIDSVLREVNRVLKSDGVFIVTVPTDYFEQYSIISTILSFLRLQKLDHQYRKLYNQFWKHRHTYPIREWEARMNANKFRVIDSIGYGTRVSTAVNDLIAPFGIFGKLRRLRGAPWTRSRSMRRVLIRPLIPLIRKTVNGQVSGQALVCLVLKLDQ